MLKDKPTRNQFMVAILFGGGQGTTGLASDPLTVLCNHYLNYGKRYSIFDDALYLLNRNGEILSSYGESDLAAWSPDGTMLAFVRNGLGSSNAGDVIHIVRLDGSTVWQYRIPNTDSWTSDLFLARDSPYIKWVNLPD